MILLLTRLLSIVLSLTVGCFQIDFDVGHSPCFFFVLAFPTERWELQLVARKFERRGLISYKEFVAALKAVSFFFSIISLYFKCVFLYQVC